MGYRIDQFNQATSGLTSSQSAANLIYLTPITSGDVVKKAVNSDNNVTSSSASINFQDEGIRVVNSFRPNHIYYFHGKIKRVDSEQKIYVKLVNFEGTDNVEQYIKTLIIKEGEDNSWVDVEFMFNPLIEFDTILFQLQRTIVDYREQERTITVIYQELDEVNNILSNKVTSNSNLLKLGVQSHPGLLMCINGEEIHIGNTGVYEVRNGIITITSFSVIAAAEEDSTALGGINLDRLMKELSVNPASICIFNTPKLRSISPFTLDYMYEEG